MLWQPVSRRARLNGAILLAMGLAPLAAGCDAMRYIAYQAQPKTETVPAEFNRLPDKTVLVSVWVPPEVKWDYPHIRLDLASHLGAYLQQNVKKITLVDAYQVEAYLDKATKAEVDPVEVGRHFHADMVVHLGVYQFSVRDPGYSQFYRGRVASSVEIYDLTTSDKVPPRYPMKEVKVAYPEDKAVGFSNARADQVRQGTYEAFATEVGKKFHSWEKPLE